MKTAIEALLRQSLDALPDELVPRAARMLDIEVQHTRDASRGDLASNLALRLARTAGAPPRTLADALVRALPANDSVARVEVAGAGFLNFFLRQETYHAQIRRALAEGDAYGRSALGQGRRVHVEFVSANLTGPLHAGHGRHAAFGAAVANLLEAAGFAVQREYHVEDTGPQREILALSTWLRYLQLCGEAVRFPARGCHGEHPIALARTLRAREGDALRFDAGEVFRDLPANGDQDAYIDALVARARSLLGEPCYRRVRELALTGILDDIRADLQEFGVVFDCWVSGRSLTEDGAVDMAIEAPTARSLAYRQDGALWCQSTQSGEEQHRVLVHDNGVRTAVAADIGDLCNQDGAPTCLDVRLVQSVTLCGGGQKRPMPIRPAPTVTLRDLRGEVGNDAARLFYVLRSNDQHLDFDVALAKARCNDNPLYDIQYAHARVASVLKQLATRGVAHDREQGLNSLARLTQPQEAALLKRIAAFPALLTQCAQQRAPHTLVRYLRDLAHEFHAYHGAHPLLVEEGAVRDARLVLAVAAQTVIRNGLKLLGVSAPATM